LRGPGGFEERGCERFGPKRGGKSSKEALCKSGQGGRDQLSNLGCFGRSGKGEGRTRGGKDDRESKSRRKKGFFADVKTPHPKKARIGKVGGRKIVATEHTSTKETP